MNYIQIDVSRGHITIVSREDAPEKPLIFRTLKEAESTLSQNCEKGIIVPLGNTIEVLKKCSAFVQEIGKTLEEDVNKFLV